MSEIVKLVLSLSLSGSILAAFLFIVKPFIKNKLSKTMQYYIWMIVLLRLVIPFSFEGSLLNHLFYNEQMPMKIINQEAGLPEKNLEENISTIQISSRLDEKSVNNTDNTDKDSAWYLIDLLMQYSLYVWLLGMLITLVVNLTGYIRFSRYIMRTNKPATDNQIKILDSILGTQHNVSLSLNPFVHTPMLLGILKPYIIIPDVPLDEKQIKNVLLHEVSHLKRFDIPVKWLMMMAISIHWFNPLVYIIRKEINNACELACDETVIKNFTTEEKQAYGDTLISVVASYKHSAAIMQATMCEEKNSLKKRLIAIMNHNRKSRHILSLTIILMIFVAFGAFYLGAAVGMSKDTPPGKHIATEYDKIKAVIDEADNRRNNRKDTGEAPEKPRLSEYIISSLITLSGDLQSNEKIYNALKNHSDLSDHIDNYEIGSAIKNDLRKIFRSRNEVHSVCIISSKGDYFTYGKYDNADDKKRIEDVIKYPDMLQKAREGKGAAVWYLDSKNGKVENIFLLRTIHDWDTFKEIGLIAILVKKEYFDSDSASNMK